MRKVSQLMKVDDRRDKKLGIKHNSPLDKKIDGDVKKSGKDMSESKMKQMMKGAKPVLTIKIMAKKKK